MKILMPFFIALQFLTKIPVNLPYLPTAQQNAYSVLYYPLIGLLIGAILWGLSISLFLPIMLKSALILAVWVWLTGGLHLDGLADTVDGFVGGYGDVERTLIIMKDPNTGAMGVMAIVILCLLKFSLIYSILELNQALMLLFVPVLGRVSILMLLSSTSYVRENGLGKHLSQFLPKIWTWVVIILSLAILLILPLAIAMSTIFISSLAVLGLRYWFKKHIGGITGDTLGASVEIIEVVSFMTMLIALTA